MGILDEVGTATQDELKSYLDGASRDGTFCARHKTLRISQKGTEWLNVLRSCLERLGSRSWIYREGRRDVWTLETRWWDPALPQLDDEFAAFARGYFDAEGGIPRDPGARFYVQFVQKDRADLWKVCHALNRLGIQTGKLHNPSVLVDPHFWRFFVLAHSLHDFGRIIGSWHPRKRALLDQRATHIGSPGSSQPTRFVRLRTSPANTP